MVFAKSGGFMSPDKNKKGLPEVIYYRNELEDEFSTAVITPKVIDGSYPYDRTKGLGRIACFFWHRIVAMPIAYCYLKLKFRHKVVGKKAFKQAKKQGFFIYGNHTQIIGDALIPTFVRVPHDAYVIVHPNNVSMKGLGKITPSLGALPLPDNMRAYKNFVRAISTRIREGNNVVIYPEAHIWPYYTKIRPFTDVSFSYPVSEKRPVFAFTNTYHKRRLFRRPRIVTYIDGPFYPDESLSVKEQKQVLRNQVYNAMCARAALSDVEVIKYIKET